MRSLILPLNPTQQSKKLGHGKRQPLEKVLDKRNHQMIDILKPHVSSEPLAAQRSELVFSVRAKIGRRNKMQTRLKRGVELWIAPTGTPFFWDVMRHESKRVAKAGLTIACFILLGWMSSGQNAFGQAVYGSIAGTVYDSSGAGVPKAAVTITDLQKNVNYATTTNDSGNYSQTHLIVGRYRVKVEMTGFKTAIQESVDLAVDTITTVDVSLQPGDLSQTINVTEEPQGRLD